MEIYLLKEYKECDTCARQPGSPPLCSGCLNNRTAINERDVLIKELNRQISIIKLIIE